MFTLYINLERRRIVSAGTGKHTVVQFAFGSFCVQRQSLNSRWTGAVQTNCSMDDPILFNLPSTSQKRVYHRVFCRRWM